MGGSLSVVSEKSLHEFTVKDSKGKDVDLSIYKGKVLLIVNVASKCGFTNSNYTQLTVLYSKYKDKGFEILAFPCNQFLKQEPDTSQDAEEFACTRFKAEYPIFKNVLYTKSLSFTMLDSINSYATRFSNSMEEDAELTPVLRLGAGACAGIIAMSATYPMDMVRDKLTVQTEKSPYQYTRMVHALRTVLREEGARGLYKGWLQSVIGVVRLLFICSIHVKHSIKSLLSFPSTHNQFFKRTIRDDYSCIKN